MEEKKTEIIEEEKSAKKTAKKAEAIPDPERRVSIYIPRAGNDEDANFFVGINGKNYLLPRGKTSTVPWYVAQEAKRSLRAREHMEARIDAMVSKE